MLWPTTAVFTSSTASSRGTARASARRSFRTTSVAQVDRNSRRPDPGPRHPGPRGGLIHAPVSRGFPALGAQAGVWIGVKKLHADPHLPRPTVSCRARKVRVRPDFREWGVLP